MTFSPLIIWAKGPFFFEQLFSVVARTWLGLKSDSLFLGPKFWGLVQKSKIREDHRFFLGPVCSALQCQKSRSLYSIMYAGIHALQVQIIRGLIKSNMIKKYIFLNHIRPDQITGDHVTKRPVSHSDFCTLYPWSFPSQHLTDLSRPNKHTFNLIPLLIFQSMF